MHVLYLDQKNQRARALYFQQENHIYRVYVAPGTNPRVLVQVRLGNFCLLTRSSLGFSGFVEQHDRVTKGRPAEEKVDIEITSGFHFPPSCFFLNYYGSDTALKELCGSGRCLTASSISFRVYHIWEEYR